MDLIIVIPAVKKNVAFPDDLVKKIAGRSLIQRTIDTAKEMVPGDDIVVVTDSEEIALISTRSNVQVHYDNTLKLEEGELFSKLRFYLLKIAPKYRCSVLLSPYCPLLSLEELQKAHMKFINGDIDFLQPVKKVAHSVFQRKNNVKLKLLSALNPKKEFFVESQAFQIFKNEFVFKDLESNMIEPVSYELGADIREIESFEDWWVCEKLLNRKKIIFRVIGNNEVGMGHIFRSLALANEITDHEIRFVCDEESGLAATKIAGYDYWLMTYPKEEIEDRIIEIEPDLVINDILDTEQEYIRKLRDKQIKVVNFEDLGTGASCSDFTVNELYDEPLIEGQNVLWGHKYFFVRDEFNNAVPCQCVEKVNALLISFGGTDQNNLTLKTLQTVMPLCREHDIEINIVCGEGYLYKEEIEKAIATSNYPKINFTCATGVISSIMEKSQIGITSNGRTVYELAHMNIPSIVVAHHSREKTHTFANESRGFINLGVYQQANTEEDIYAALDRLLSDGQFRSALFKKIQPYQFSKNKRNLLKLIISLLEQ